MPKLLRYISALNKRLLLGTLSTIILKLLKDHDEMDDYEIVQSRKDATLGALHQRLPWLWPGSLPFSSKHKRKLSIYETAKIVQ